jgi:hypothetical protein
VKVERIKMQQARVYRVDIRENPKGEPVGIAFGHLDGTAEKILFVGRIEFMRDLKALVATMAEDEIDELPLVDVEDCAVLKPLLTTYDKWCMVESDSKSVTNVR